MRGIGAGANVPSLSRDAGERAANAGTSSIASERKVMAHPRAADARTPLKAYMLDAASYRSAADTALSASTSCRQLDRASRSAARTLPASPSGCAASTSRRATEFRELSVAMLCRVRSHSCARDARRSPRRADRSRAPDASDGGCICPANVGVDGASPPRVAATSTSTSASSRRSALSDANGTRRIPSQSASAAFFGDAECEAAADDASTVEARRGVVCMLSAGPLRRSSSALASRARAHVDHVLSEEAASSQAPPKLARLERGVDDGLADVLAADIFMIAASSPVPASPRIAANTSLFTASSKFVRRIRAAPFASPNLSMR